MLELDYAFLAEYASIQDGNLTTVGGSFTRLVTPQLPVQAFLAVAGRIRCDEPQRETVDVTIRITSPGDDQLKIEATNRLDASETTHAPYDGHKRGIIFAAQIGVPLIEAGTYTVEVDIDETEGVDRVLKFEVVTEGRGEQFEGTADVFPVAECHVSPLRSC
ncbi:DUF6941 family protein [Actinomyces qiguomingii]|uniref:DUF6941 family protein n=1 Tax=Actinomyces qiguomingii TaxID=2057800 RepID=UPI00157FAD3A|nr:hypothetical protein [Actinomyces qiguomingii]